MKNLLKKVKESKEKTELKYKKRFKIGDTVKIEGKITGIVERINWWHNKVEYMYFIDYGAEVCSSFLLDVNTEKNN